MESEAYLKNEDLKALQETALSILEYFKSVCEKNGFSYYLAYGTLLGAVRHQGFIPWDDDVDVWMPREDYMALLSFLENNEDERYVVSRGKNRPKGEWNEKLQMKILDSHITVESLFGGRIVPSHPWIDVFALDDVPDDHGEYLTLFNKKRKKYQLCRSKHIYYTKLKGVKGIVNKTVYTAHNKLHLLKRVMDENKAADRLFDALTSYKGKEGEDYFCNASVYLSKIDRCFFKKKWFDGNTELCYGDVSFSVPVGYDEILKKIYGDYMTLPPPEQRHGGHFGKILSRK